MAELPQLTLAFLQSQPSSAARAIEVLPPANAAALLENVPVRISAPVLAAMTSLAAARCIALLPPEIGAALCEALSWPDTSALLRQLDTAHRDAILSQLPAATARRFSRSLGYLESEVGTWVNMDAPAMNEDRTVGEAMKLLARLPDFTFSHLILTDDTQQYKGLVALSALLRTNTTVALAAIAKRDCRAVRDRASVGTVASSHDWDTTTLLPVVNHRGELLGGLTRTALNRALHARRGAAPVASHSMLATLLDAYFVAGDGLLRMMLRAGDAREPQARRNR